MTAHSTMTAPGRPARGAAGASNAMPSWIEAKLVAHHHDFLRFLIRRLGDASLAEEVLQEFYLRVVRRAATLRQSDSVLAWLYKVLRSTLIDHHRRETARRRRESDFALLHALTHGDGDEEPAGRDYKCLYEVLPTLRPGYLDVLRRVDLCGAPPRKVAAELGIGANTVRVRLHRARQALKRALIQHCGDRAGRKCGDCACGAAGDRPTIAQRAPYLGGAYP